MPPWIGYWLLFWPVLMIAAGLPLLVAPKDSSEQVFGLVLTGIGVFLQLQKLGHIPWTLAQSWPLLLVIADILLVTQALGQKSDPSGDRSLLRRRRVDGRPPATALSTPTAEGPKGRLAIGLVFIAVGLVLTFDQAGVLNLDGFGRFWPLLLIGIGIVKVRQPIEDGQRAVGTGFSSWAGSSRS